MHQPTQSDRNIDAPYPGLKEPYGSLVAHAQLALKRQDIAECNRIVDWANEHPSSQSTSALAVLTAKPRSGLGLIVWKHQPWVDMRVCAVKALASTRSSLAAPALAHSLMFETGESRFVAKDALKEMGARAAPALIQSINSRPDWPMHGMLETIATISTMAQPGQPAVYRALYYILTGNWPAAGERWRKCTVGWYVGVGIITALVIALVVIPLITESLPWYEVFNAIPGAMLITLILSATCAVPLGFVVKHMKKQEAVKLTAAAADAIIRIKDPRYVKMLLDVATGRFLFWSKYGASRALIALLPGTGIKSYYKLDSAHEQKLIGLLGAKNGDLTVAVVRSLEFVGSGQSAESLELFLRRSSAANDTKAEASAVTEALRVLPILQERRRQEQAASTLLRSSQADGDTGERLLRPASDYAFEEEQVDELLRPG